MLVILGFNDNVSISPDLLDLLIKTLTEVADIPPEEDEHAINKIRGIIQRIIGD
ncbi:MAG: hypothetical protein L7G92_00430 [Stygiolobus sp.]|nr:hypothetical protein [Stygiolobus sp.]